MKFWEEIEVARNKVRKAILPTPTVHSDAISKLTGKEVFLTLENLQKYRCQSTRPDHRERTCTNRKDCPVRSSLKRCPWFSDKTLQSYCPIPSQYPSHHSRTGCQRYSHWVLESHISLGDPWRRPYPRYQKRVKREGLFSSDIKLKLSPR